MMLIFAKASYWLQRHCVPEGPILKATQQGKQNRADIPDESCDVQRQTEKSIVLRVAVDLPSDVSFYGLPAANTSNQRGRPCGIED